MALTAPRKIADPPGDGLRRHLPTALALVWALGAGYLLLSSGPASLGDTIFYVVVPIAVLLPLALVWIAATVGRMADETRGETARLSRAIDALRRDYAGLPQPERLPPEVAGKLDSIAAAQKKTDATLARFISIRPAAPAPPPPPTPGALTQASLSLGVFEAAAQTPPLVDFITALQFPADAEDRDGFRALRRALQDRRTAQLITAAQDVLTLLSQDGLYMDDLTPDRTHPDVWRRFARGERGRIVATLGGIHDPDALGTVTARMRADTIFRDAAHHFLRLFDHIIAEIEPQADDSQFARLGDTRSARAFMLLGRAAGIFD